MDIKQLLESRMEPVEVRDMVAAWCEKNAGKRLQKNRLPEGFHIHQIANMTQIRDNEYRDTAGERGYNFLLAYAVVNVEVPTVERLKEYNMCYFAGIDQRNAARRAWLADPGKLNCLQARINFVIETREQLKQHEADLKADGWLDWQFPDLYEVERLAGMRQ